MHKQALAGWQGYGAGSHGAVDSEPPSDSDAQADTDAEQQRPDSAQKSVRFADEREVAISDAAVSAPLLPDIGMANAMMSCCLRKNMCQRSVFEAAV